MSRKWKETSPAKFTNDIAFRTVSDLRQQHVISVVVCINSNLPNNRNCEVERGPTFFFPNARSNFFKQKPISGSARQLLHSASTQIQSTLMIVSISPPGISLTHGSILSISQVTLTEKNQSQFVT